MRNFIDVDLGENSFEKLIACLRPEEKLTASAVLAMLDAGEEADDFAELDVLSIALDISDLPKAAGSGEAAVRLRREEQLVQQGKLLTALEDGDPLRLYLEEIASVPICGDVAVLAEELLAANATEREVPDLWTRLLNLSLSRVVEIAQEYTGYGVLLLDLIQEGSMSMWQFLPCYCGGDFEQLRDLAIHNAMKKAVILQAHANGVGQKMRQAIEDYRAVDERLLSELGRNATVEEIAEEMHISPEEAATVRDTLDSARLLSRAKEENMPAEETPEDEQHVEDTALFQARQRIMELLSNVSQEDAKLLSLRFGLEGGLPMSPEETGRKLGLTPEEVVQREAAALAQLRGSEITEMRN